MTMGAALNGLLLLSVLVGAVLCCQPPDCDTPDCGSCAQACCGIEFDFSVSTDTVYQAIVASLKKGGADTRYTFVNGTDYRKDNISVKYQLQAIHSTMVHHYNDTIDMLVYYKDTTHSLVKAFSISRIEGAYCDEGQNYKNLVGFMKGLQPAEKYTGLKIIWGCKKSTFLGV